VQSAEQIEIQIRPQPVRVGLHRHARASAKKGKSPRLSPALSPKTTKSPRLSPRAAGISPGLRHATNALLFDTLELPTALKGAKRQELEHRAIALSRCSRYTALALRAPRLFHSTRGPRAVC
jgi:hypothetical protein